MTKSSNGIIISIILLTSVLGINLPDVSAAEISVKSIAFEETTIIEFTNDSNIPINTFRIWLGSDLSFKSFKTEKGWIGEKTPQGVIIFTSSEFVQPGDSVKFGVKTNKPKPGINWKALDPNGKQVDIGKTLAEDLPKPTEKSKPSTESNGILSDSVFRIIPEKPNVGSTIRVTGEKFSPTQEFQLYLDERKIDSFVTNDAGQFMITTKIPENIKADRVNFLVKDGKGNEKKLSLRLGESEDRVPETEIVKLTISGIDSVLHRGDFVEIFGTAQPNSAITAKIINPSGKTITTESAEVDSKGKWKIVEPIIIPLDAPLGKYTIEMTDGRDTIIRTWTVESDKKIMIEPTKLKFEIGEIITFNGTAIPNLPIELIIEDPIDQEVFSDVLNVDETGFIEFGMETNNDFEEGTYTLFASQGKEIELTYVGLGEIPQIPVNVQFEKLNYKNNEDVEMLVTGEPDETISLLVVDPSDKPIGNAEQIKIGPDGKGKYTIDLDGFASGVYTVVVSKGTSKSSEIFTVGLQLGSGEININTTKIEYETGEQVLVLGNTNPNVLLELTLLDPDGNEVKTRETFSDKEGRISNNSFRIPSEAKPGMWSIRAQSGSNFDIHEFEVLGTKQEGMIISVVKGGEIPGVGQSINIKVIGAQPSSTVFIQIFNESGEMIDEITFPASSEGKIDVPWTIPKDLPPGNYKFKSEDSFDSAETQYTIE